MEHYLDAMTEEVKPLQELQIEVLNIRKASLVIRAINNKTRQRILDMLHENRRMNVTSIYQRLGSVQFVTSVHLSILKKVGVVNTERQVRFIFYSINYKRLAEIKAIATRLLI